METISELRDICHNTRAFKSHNRLSRFYYRVSIYFTSLFLRLGMTANHVTVLSGIVAIISAFFLSASSIYLVLVGVLFLSLSSILDYSDGEVARYYKSGTITGHFLDWYMHNVISSAMFIGLAFGALSIKSNMFMVLFSILAIVRPIIDYAIISSGWTVICWTRLQELKFGRENMKTYKWDFVKEEKNATNVESIKLSAGFRNKLNKHIYWWLRFITVGIFQHFWAPFLLLLLTLLQIIINLTGLSEFDFRPLLIIYSGIVGPFYIIYKVTLLVKSNALEDGYNRLFENTKKINIPDDFFFY